MNTYQAIQKTREICRLKHYALKTERSYCGSLWCETHRVGSSAEKLGEA